MRVALKQIKSYSRLILVLVAAVAILIVLFKNRSNTVTFWFFGFTDTDKPVNVVWLLISTAAATRIALWVINFGLGMFRDFKELKRLKAVESEQDKQKKREADLNKREQRLDDKLKQALDENESDLDIADKQDQENS